MDLVWALSDLLIEPAAYEGLMESYRQQAEALLAAKVRSDAEPLSAPGSVEWLQDVPPVIMSKSMARHYRHRHLDPVSWREIRRGNGSLQGSTRQLDTMASPGFFTTSGLIIPPFKA
jgi:hypothetical protein